MRIISLIGLCGVLLISGCSSLQESANVPLPETTPFDTNPMARDAYLQAYREGYLTAAEGQNTSREFLYGPYRFPRELGWKAGVLQGFQGAGSNSGVKPPNQP